MQKRSLLRSQLIQAWKETIETRYDQRLINSERGLQTYFCMALMEAFEAANLKRRVFIEPCISARGFSGIRYPDIVICNSRSVIGVIELKYLPKRRPQYTKDIETLEMVGSSSENLNITNDRYLGAMAFKKPYPLSRDAVLCWAGVYTGKAIVLNSQVSVTIRKRFLQLNAITSADFKAAIMSS